MGSERNFPCHDVQTKGTSVFGSPIMWTDNKDQQFDNVDNVVSKQTQNETGRTLDIFDVKFDKLNENERKSDNVMTRILGNHSNNKQNEIALPVESDKKKEEIMTDNKASVRNIKRTRTVLSDSDEYDTDLEADNNPEKENQKSRKVGGSETYIKSCRHWKVKPLSCVTDNLTKQSLTLRNKSVGPKSIFPLCTALKVTYPSQKATKQVEDSRHSTQSVHVILHLLPIYTQCPLVANDPHLECIKHNQCVERLNLNGVDITDDGIQNVAELLLHNDTITHVNVSNNNIGMRGAQAIGHVMVVTETLTHLNLAGNKMNDEAAWYLTSGINSNTSITHLDISYNEFGLEAGVLLGSTLARNSTLTWLNLCWNKIYGRGAVAIFRGLMVNTTIERLDISWNGLGYEGSVALSKCLKVNTKLRYLNVANNRIDWRCAFLLAEGLRSNESLSKLKIGFNPLTTTGVMDILEAVATGSSGITCMDCSEVPVLCSADLLAATVGRLRTFTFLHGGIVSTHDKLGERIGQKLNPMLRIIEYLRLLGLRPLELLKSFDKSVSFEMPREEFIDQIKKIGVKLHPYEIDALANSVSGKGYNRNVINYRKLSLAVRDVVEAERRRKIKERDEWRQMKDYQKTILKRGTVDELMNSSNAFSDTLNPLSSRSTNTITPSLQGSTNPSTHKQHKMDVPMLSRRLQKRSTKEMMF